MIDDQTIIALFFARSEEGITAVDSRYGRLCRSLAYNILHNREDAEECVNDAYLGLWNAIPPAKPAALLPYLCKIVRNLSLKAYQKKGAAKRNSQYTLALEELPELGTMEEALDVKELAHIIEGFLDTQSRENRVIFLRRYWFADSCQDIACRVGLTEKTVTVRLTRIRQKLKVYLRESGVFI